MEAFQCILMPQNYFLSSRFCILSKEKYTTSNQCWGYTPKPVVSAKKLWAAPLGFDRLSQRRGGSVVEPAETSLSKPPRGRLPTQGFFALTTCFLFRVGGEATNTEQKEFFWHIGPT
ncbi:hypothetical protein [Candidatus Viridilinea mediisalina]|uniref:hypothetical protein n=1 Tax=Candidatus Viridilinea mediisalina TaxID=2024553 RepID=UPI000F5A302F|nr:hypothetical protein [Candidatus Viridilinea mediisalina]